jgi:ABC-type antimicrobial peptide transport system permease subunit
MATLSSFFGVLAIVLTAVGIYGVVAYTVSLRQNEIGIRVALGADRRGIFALMSRDMVAVLGFGLSAGMLLTLAAEHAASAFLFNLSAVDWEIYAAASSFLTILVLISSYFPTAQGASLDPMQVLRKE